VRSGDERPEHDRHREDPHPDRPQRHHSSSHPPNARTSHSPMRQSLLPKDLGQTQTKHPELAPAQIPPRPLLSREGRPLSASSAARSGRSLRRHRTHAIAPVPPRTVRFPPRERVRKCDGYLAGALPPRSSRRGARSCRYRRANLKHQEHRCFELRSCGNGRTCAGSSSEGPSDRDDA
jgi:hypothetical protein